jgi:hypothetical protein
VLPGANQRLALTNLQTIFPTTDPQHETVPELQHAKTQMEYPLVLWRFRIEDPKFVLELSGYG